MSVYNAVGEGPTSPPQEVFVGEAGMHTSSYGQIDFGGSFIFLKCRVCSVLTE